jgi:hypothetical protein
MGTVRGEEEQSAVACETMSVHSWKRAWQWLSLSGDKTVMLVWDEEGFQ